MSPTAPPLAALAPLLAEEPALRAVIGRAARRWRCPTPARALFVAALAGVTHAAGRSLLAVPTGAEAERLARDLGAVPRRRRGRAVPGVGDAAVRAGVAVARDDGPAPAGACGGSAIAATPPAVVVAPVRALVQRLGPHVEDVEPIVVRPGDQRRPRRAGRAARRRRATGASTRWRRAARSRCAARSSTCTRRPTTTRCASTSGATRSTASRRSRSPTSAPPTTSPRRAIFPTRELLPTAEVRARAAALVARAAVGPRAVGAPRRGPGVRRHGVVAAVAHRAASTCCPTCCPPTRSVLLVEPQPHARPRPGAARRRGVARGDARGHLGRGRRATTSRASRSTFDRLLAHTGAGAVSLLATPDAPRHARASPPARSTPSSATPTRSPAACARSRATATASCSRPRAPAPRSACTTSSPARASTSARGEPAPGAVRLVVAPLERGVVLPGAQLALVAEADLTGRRRVHRRARGARRGADYYDDLEPGRLRRAPPCTASAATSR